MKAFLEELKSIGSIRIITNNGLAVLESVTTFDGLFYSPTPKGEYANIIKPKENVDLHLLLPRCRAATLESAEGRGGGYTSHFCRLLDEAGTVAVTFYLMWPVRHDCELHKPSHTDACFRGVAFSQEGAARGAYADGQEAAFTALKAKHGARVDFAG